MYNHWKNGYTIHIRFLEVETMNEKKKVIKKVVKDKADKSLHIRFSTKEKDTGNFELVFVKVSKIETFTAFIMREGGKDMELQKFFFGGKPSKEELLVFLKKFEEEFSRIKKIKKVFYV